MRRYLRWLDQSKRMKAMSEKSHAMTAAAFLSRSRGMDEAIKAGLGAAACSVLILAVVFLAMHTLPVSFG